MWAASARIGVTHSTFSGGGVLASTLIAMFLVAYRARCVWASSLSDLGRLTSENRPQRGQFLPDLQAHSPAMGQNEVSVKTHLYSSYVGTKKMVRAKCGVSQKWTAAVDLQPTFPQSDRLL